jgi:glucokinase
MSNPITLGIDLGGTGIKLGLVDAQGRLLQTQKMLTPSKCDPRHVVDLMVAKANLLLRTLKNKKIKGIGVGTAGDVDPNTGTVRISPNLSWHDVPLKRLLRSRLKYPIRVDNDANVAAWAAYVVEAKRRVANLLCVTVGTGVGGGLILNHTLYRGTTGSAAEIGDRKSVV